MSNTMFFQTLSPPQKLVKPKVEKPAESEEITIISLAPFTHNPKVCFQEVPLGVATTKKLHIKNPTKFDIELYITKGPPDERDVCYTWVQQMVPSENSVFLELTWTPQEIGSWRDIISLEDGNRIRKDIPLIFKSVSPKKTVKKPKKQIKPITAKIKPSKSPTKKAMPTFKSSPLRRRSSPPKIRVSPVKILKQKPQVDNVISPLTEKFKQKPQREIVISPLSQKLKQNTQISPLMEKVHTPILDPPERRQTYLINNKENMPNSTFNMKEQFLSPGYDEILEDSLENEVKATPTINNKFGSSRVTINFDDIMLTPIADNFNPSICSSGERTRLNATYDLQLNSSRATYVKGDISDTSLADFNNSIKNNATSPARTYIKPTEAVGNCCLQDLEDFNEVNFNSTVSLLPQADRGLQKIVEESFEGSEVEESSLLKSNRKRKSEIKLVAGGVVLSPKRGNYCEISVTPLRKKNVKSSSNLKDFITKSRELKSKAELILHNPDEYLRNNLQNPYILAATGNVDPFLSASSYYEPRWLDEQEIRFKKWLNVILIPPEDLRAVADGHPNIAKIWMECKKCEVDKAPTKEEISNKTAVRGRLDKLRGSAVELFKTREVSQVLSKLAVMVESGKLSIRNDKKVHLDLGLQQEIMILFLSYNPLWLRVGLETIFGRTLKLHSNSDIMGISLFIMSNFFKDAYLLHKYKHIHSEKYAVDIKKHILKKFLMLIYFLDVAKEKRLIQYDPCLFCKNAPFKESKEVLFKFTSALLSAVGDITKYLKHSGYVLTHKQTYIHEFDYSVNIIGADLRDGVRLTRVMEVILLKNNLIPLMRVPAISRLQKIHNVKVAFTALEQADYMIQQDIMPKDIVDGHREKTLSLLWQIIYKFEAPLVKKSTITIQRWWNSLAIMLKRRVLRRKREALENAARKIQLYYKGWKLMQLERVEYLTILKAVGILQTWFRSKLEMLITRRLFIEKREAAITIQRRLRVYKEGQQQRKLFIIKKQAAIVIQHKFRATLLMYQARNAYLNYKNSAIKIQLFYKARLETKIERYRFLSLKKSVLTITNWWLMLKQRAAYKQLRNSVVLLQNKWRAVLKMRVERVTYTQLKQSTVTIQRLYRAKISMRIAREDYVKKRLAVLVIQRRLREYQLMKTARNEFLRCRNAAMFIQKYYRGYLMMKREQSVFKSLKKAVVYVEEKRIAQIKARCARSYYLKLRKCTVFLQQKYRANCACKLQRANYLKLRLAIVKVQVVYRGLLMMRQCREELQRKKRAAVVVQRFFRGWLETRRQVEILRKKLFVIKGMQCYIRGFLARRLFKKLTSPEAVLMRKQNKAAIKILAIWRGYAVRKAASNEIAQIRNHLKKVSTDVCSQKTIGSRKDEALQVLINENSSYLQVVNALRHIEYITRRHKDSCLSLSEYIPEMTANIIVTSGRSDPDSIACIRGADILINFIKYPPASKNAWLPEYITGFVTTMVHWCDKELSVFPLLCTVIWLYSHNSNYLKHMKTMPNLKQQFLKMQRLCERKQKMMSVARRNPSGNVQFAKFKSLPLPSLKPDWGLELKTKPRAFTNSLHAINTLIGVFEFD